MRIAHTNIKNINAITIRGETNDDEINEKQGRNSHCGW